MTETPLFKKATKPKARWNTHEYYETIKSKGFSESESDFLTYEFAQEASWIITLKNDITSLQETMRKLYTATH